MSGWNVVPLSGTVLFDMGSVRGNARTRWLVFVSLVAASLLAPSAASAQRRRRVSPQATTPQATTPQAATPQAATPQAATPQAATPQATTPQAATPMASSATSSPTSGSGRATPTTSGPSATSAASTERSAPAAEPSATSPTDAQPRSGTNEGARPPALDVRFGLGVVGRSFWYTDDLFMALRPHRLTAAPAVQAGVEWYPGAHFTRGVAAMFGLVLDGGYTLVFSASDAQGRAYPTTAFHGSAGVRARLWLPERLDVGVLIGAAAQSFAIDRTAVAVAPAMGIASATHVGLRGGITGRAQLVRRIALTAGSTFHYVLTSGELTSREFFPRAQVWAVDASLGVAVALVRSLEVRANAEWRRYFAAMNPVPGDRFIAGGAVDDNYAATVSIALRR